MVQSITNSIMKCENCGFTFNLSFPQRRFIWEFKKLNKLNVPCPNCQKRTLTDIGDAQFNGVYPVYEYNSISRRIEAAITIYIFAAIITAFVVTSIIYASGYASLYLSIIILLLILVPILIYLSAVKNATISHQSDYP